MDLWTFAACSGFKQRWRIRRGFRRPRSWTYAVSALLSLSLCRGFRCLQPQDLQLILAALFHDLPEVMTPISSLGQDIGGGLDSVIKEYEHFQMGGEDHAMIPSRGLTSSGIFCGC
jgi:hypothetical protein